MTLPLLKIPVEVYRTNITSSAAAQRLKAELLRQFPECLVDFDLEDCDHILRVEGVVDSEMIQGIALQMDICIEELTD